jgi:hypothetical protein
MKSFLCLLLISSIASAQVVHLDKGSPSPFEGYLFSIESEKANRKSLLDLDIYKELDASNRRMLDLKTQENTILTQQYVLWKDQSASLSKQLVSARNDTFWHSLLYFGLGCLVTTGLAYAVNKATR